MKETRFFFIDQEKKTYLNMILKKLIFLMTILALGYVVVYGQDDSREAYIRKYKKIAIKEMDRTGVPASIKLAQGILESNAGKSTLANKANNHFGIKCGPSWTGKTYMHEDDDYDENGQLIKSCFRVYKSVQDCYIAHSEFIRDPNKKYRYGFLFELDPKDYKAWANGLKKAGYATSPTYAEKLIGVIENYKLYRYDSGYTGDDKPDDEEPASGSKKRIKINGVTAVIADGEKSVRDIALNEEVPLKSLLKYNEKLEQSTDIPPKSSIVYLKKKRDGYRGRDTKFHQVKAGETMFDISQKYGVKLSKLLKRNRMKKGEQPAVGERIKLRGWFKVKEKPETRDASQEEALNEDDNEDGFMDGDETMDLGDDKEEDFDSTETEIFDENGTDENDNPAAGPVFHMVVKGETLYGIARRYETTIDQIKSLNKLAVDVISVGQRLRVK
jgi:LysM repeat protein